MLQKAKIYTTKTDSFLLLYLSSERKATDPLTYKMKCTLAKHVLIIIYLGPNLKHLPTTYKTFLI